MVRLVRVIKPEGPLLSGIWHLHKVDWLEHLPEEELQKLRAASILRSYGAGELIFAPETSPGSLYLLASGLVRIYRVSPDGAESAFGYIAAGEIFGELALFHGVDRESFADAVRESEVWKIPRNVFAGVLEQSSELMLAVTRQIASRFKRIESRIENLVFRDARSRVAMILCELAEDFGRPVDDGLLIDIDLTQAELATLVGITRQTANVYLREFEELGILTRARRLVTVRDPEALRQIARGPTPDASSPPLTD